MAKPQDVIQGVWNGPRILAPKNVGFHPNCEVTPVPLLEARLGSLLGRSVFAQPDKILQVSSQESRDYIRIERLMEFQVLLPDQGTFCFATCIWGLWYRWSRDLPRTKHECAMVHSRHLQGDITCQSWLAVDPCLAQLPTTASELELET